MAFLPYLPASDISPADRVPDTDHIIRIHGVHSRVMKQHYDLYVELMHKAGTLSRIQRELIAVTVSVANRCHY